MATINKNFRIKSGLIVEGSTGTINGQNILTETGGDQYILNLVGGATLVKSVDVNTFTVDGSGNLTINANTFDSYGSAAAAQTAAEGYADNAATAAENNAKAYADGLASNYDEAGSADAAEIAANTYTDNTLINYTKTSDLDSTVGGYGYLKSADLNGYATETYVNNAVSDLVNGAPELLDTLNELAAAIGDDANYATTVSNLIADKQNNLTAGDNIALVNDVISVTGLDTDDVAENIGATNLYFTDARAVSAVTGLNNPTYYTLAEKDGKAGVYKSDVASTLGSETGSGIVQNPVNNSALQIDRSVVDGWYDANGAASQALTDAQSYADTAESDAISSAATYTDGQITNLTDGTNSFQTVNIEDVVAQRAATTFIGIPNQTPVFTWDASDYRSAKILVKVANGVHTQISELMVTLDTSDNVAVSEYGITYSNGTELAAITADFLTPGSVRVLATPANSGTDVTVFATLVI